MDPNYFPNNGFQAHPLGLNSFFNIATLPNYIASYSDFINFLMRSQMEHKSFKDLPEPFLNGINNGLVNTEELEKQMKNKFFENTDLNSLRKFFQLFNDQAAVSKADANPAHVLPNLQNEQNLSTSFLNLSKMSHLDQPKMDDLEDSKRLDSKKGQSNEKEVNGKDNGIKMESDEESQRDSSSLDDEMLMADGKKVRVRSVLSEETLRVLRAQYAINPRPKKQEIHRLAEQVNYPPRVVQVWFQNMR